MPDEPKATATAEQTAEGDIKWLESRLDAQDTTQREMLTELQAIKQGLNNSHKKGAADLRARLEKIEERISQQPQEPGQQSSPPTSQQPKGDQEQTPPASQQRSESGNDSSATSIKKTGDEDSSTKPEQKGAPTARSLRRRL